MGDDFKTVDRIEVRTNDANFPYAFDFQICSSASANDGAVPYGLTISSVTVTAHNAAGTDKTSSLINSSSLSGTTVTVYLKYPGTAGVYHLNFKLTLSSGATKDYVFEKVDAL